MDKNIPYFSLCGYEGKGAQKVSSQILMNIVLDVDLAMLDTRNLQSFT